MTRSSDTSRESALLGWFKWQFASAASVAARSGQEPRSVSRGSAPVGLATTCLLTLLCSGGCIRFHYDPPAADAATDAGRIDDAEPAEAALAADDGGADETGTEAAPPPPPPLCQGRDISIADKVAADTVAALQQDCRVGAYFNSLAGIQLDHFEQCFAVQLGSALGCVRGDGSKVKYPTFDSYRELCRDMKSAHAALAASDGDYEAFMSDFVAALSKNQFNASEIARISKAYGSTRSDIVRLKDAGPTRACEAGADAAGADARAKAGADAADVDADAAR